jgi:hypothetical protein
MYETTLFPRLGEEIQGASTLLALVLVLVLARLVTVHIEAAAPAEIRCVLLQA